MATAKSTRNQSVDEDRRFMSFVLYLIGAALFLWSGYLLVTGDFIATLDIAAGLAGSGAFAVGLGAVAGAIGRLTRTIAASAAARDAPSEASFERDLPPPPPRRAPPSRPVIPVEPEPMAAVAPAPELYLERALDLEPRPATEPVFEPAPARRAEARVETTPPAPAVFEAPEPEPAPPPLTKRERRRLQVMGETDSGSPTQPGVEAPMVVAPILGGGFAARRAIDTPPVEAPAIVAEDAQAAAEEPIAEAPSAEEPVSEEPAAADKPVAAAAPAVEPEAVAPPSPPAEPKVPEWLARARARREARVQVETPNEPGSTGAPAMLAAPEAPTGVEVEPAAEHSPIEPSADVAPRVEASEPEPGRDVLREGEHNGVLYRFFADGSVEAQSEHGMRRFTSLEELRATILAVRGHIDDDVEDDATTRPEAELMVAPPQENQADGPERPAGGRTPDPARPDDDFEAALAALEGRAENAPRLDEIRPSREP